jgi:hypothetical protein
MISDLRVSALTFRKCTLEKLAFIILNLVDMGLTVVGLSFGAHELNPLMHNMCNNPYQLYLAKLVIPLFLAWLLPGKLLIPSIALLTFVVGWDIRELLSLFIY